MKEFTEKCVGSFCAFFPQKQQTAEIYTFQDILEILAITENQNIFRSVEHILE